MLHWMRSDSELRNEVEVRVEVEGVDGMILCSSFWKTTEEAEGQEGAEGPKGVVLTVAGMNPGSRVWVATEEDEGVVQ